MVLRREDAANNGKNSGKERTAHQQIITRHKHQQIGKSP